MNMLMRLDLYLWNHFIPKINAEFFRSKFNSFLAMAYISLYKLPRKFLLNYIRGKEEIMFIDSKKLIIRNQEVLNKLKETLQSDFERGRFNGSVHICQTNIYDPNYRYSVGSFWIDYAWENEKVKISIRSNYRFQKSPDRITKHLHNWLFTMKNNRNASDFKIEGKEWITDLQELNGLNVNDMNQKTPNLKLLV